ncbi:MAG: endonuclease MutS2 [Bacilli bacterium]|nr:endonuclease MutS2 [Bacilli bacterium]
MQDAFVTLDFKLVEEKVSSYARTQRGKNALLDLKILDKESLSKELSYTSEANDLYARYGRMPIDASSDMEQAIEMASKGAVLEIEQLDKIAYDILLSEQVSKFFKQVTLLPLLIQYVSNLPSLGYLEKEIHKIIAPDLSIFDNASPTLKGIRIKMARMEKEMVRKLGFALDSNRDFLSSDQLTMRNGHYVLPVKNSYKSQVKGILQDVSSSGATAFIEPEVLVQMNNQMMELKNQEKEEIHRLLGILSQEVGNHAEEVKLMNRMIGYLDFLQAKALYCDEIKGHVANISKEKEIYLPRARHPLIDPKKVVANDFSLTEEKRAIVISGPNAGGKTVSLKTVGLLILMHECGLPIPTAEGAEISYIKHVYTDIGDSQSLLDNLSTFSGHMRNISGIFNSVGGNDLVLLDEIGIGTSPQEGEAIAYASIKYLIEKHCFVMVSSHFEGLKAFALSEKRIMNASMIYDVEGLRPTYKLRMGLPGESYGLSVALRYGVDASIIETAKSYLHEHEDVSVSKAIERLNELSSEEEARKEAIFKQEEELKKARQRFENDEKLLQKKKDEYLKDVESQKAKMLEKAQQEIDDILKSLDRDGLKPHEIIEARKKMRDLEDTPELIQYDGEVEVGDYAAIPDYGVVGKVTAIKGKNVELISTDGLSFKVSKDRVTRTDAPKETPKVKTGAYVDSLAATKGVPLELNMIGLHVDEAYAALDHYLDQCRLRHHHKVRIIHGLGSGALRNMTHEYCKKHSDFIEKYEIAGQYDGGGGATLVYLK